MKTYLVSGIAIAAACYGGVSQSQEPNARAAQVEEGKRIYDYWCETCHGSALGLPGFDGLPGTQQLRIKYRGTNVPALLEERTLSGRRVRDIYLSTVDELLEAHPTL